MAGKVSRKEGSKPVWELEDIRAILDLLSERGISEFEMEKNGFRVRIKRHVDEAVPPAQAAPALRDAPVSAPQPASPAVDTARSVTSSEAEVHPGLHLVKSPIVGTFYGAADPDTPSYVKVGDAVQAGQVLCIIEAMKLMNEIVAETAGEVARIFVENGQPVEYGQPLFGIIPSDVK
ncbi:MAG: acetyl-CoA carboxylase biotin carboxyl carrier protein [Terriglobia bacterium]